jgi:hypothetical protein
LSPFHQKTARPLLDDLEAIGRRQTPVAAALGVPDCGTTSNGQALLSGWVAYARRAMTKTRF